MQNTFDRFGGVGAGAAWEREIKDFIIRTFYQDRKKKRPSTTTVRRLGVAPHRTRKASVLKLYCII